MISEQTWPVIISSLQALNAVVWVGVIFQFHAAVVRIFRRLGRDRDAAAAWLCALGAAQTAFSIHWLTDGHAIASGRPIAALYFWAACYFVNATAGIGLSYTLQNNINKLRHEVLTEETNGRARRALLIWAVVAVLCFGLALVST